MQITNVSGRDQNWFFRYKLYHLPFWFIYHYLWWVVAMGNPVKAMHSIMQLPFAVKFSFYVVFQALAVYFNLYYLIPRYLEKNKLVQYLGYLLATVLVASLFIVSGYYFSSYISGRSLAELYGGGSEADCFFRFMNNALPSTMASMTLAMSIKLTKNWIETTRRQQLLEKEKLETELKFLRNQFNPHFLFNTINSIFFLIHKNADMASDALAKFSDLLRYQLYECNDFQIPLGKELAYMENFIELERLRQNDDVSIDVQTNYKGQGNPGIAPFVLIVFVENAFKHLSRNTDEANWIFIKTHLEDQELEFTISNSSSNVSRSTEILHYGGIGLKNVKRRLDLIYPGQYNLDIQSSDVRFDVKLRVTLSELVVAQYAETPMP